jgi:hypothetical protein
MTKTYTPRADSLPARLIAHLQPQKIGTKISVVDIESRFNVGRNNVSTLLTKAVNAGMLVRTRSVTGTRPYEYGLSDGLTPTPTTRDAEDPGSPFTNLPEGYTKLPAGDIVISCWSDGEVYVHGLQVMSDGSVLVTHQQMCKIVLQMTDPLGLRA